MSRTAARIAATAQRLLRRRGRVEAAPAYELHPTVCRALAQATVHERAGGDERHSRIVVSVPGSQPFLAGDSAATADALRARFPKEITSPSQAEVAARHLKEALRQRAKARKASANWTTSW